MKGSILLAILSLLIVSNGLRISQHQAGNGESIIVGGYSPISVDKLSDDAKEVDQFIRNKHPNLQNATLFSAETQVVAGLNYHFKYRSADGKTEWDIIVYKNLKGKLLENGFSFTETLPNGQKVTAMADPASSFVKANIQKPTVKKEEIVGGYSPIPVSNLSDDAKQVDQFIRSKHTDLQGATLISAENQVVAGFNYHYKYRSADGKKDWDIIVYKNLKGELVENGFTFTQTLPNGQKITAIGDPASAFTGANNQQPSVNKERRPLPGGYSPAPVTNLSDDAKKVDQFIRSKHSDLQGATLVSAETQVVAGMNYHYKYKSADGKTEWDVVVYKNLKGELSESEYSFTKTLPNGQKATAIADPASAFTGVNNEKPSLKDSGKLLSSALPTSFSNTQKTESKSAQKNDSNSFKTYLNVFPNAVSPRPVS